MTAVLVSLSAAQTRPLRQLILRPHQTADELVYPGDDAPDSLHVGILVDQALVGIASIYREAPSRGVTFAGWWRLRGMIAKFRGAKAWGAMERKGFATSDEGE